MNRDSFQLPSTINNQRGAVLLILTLIMGVLASLTLTVYLLLLSQTTKALTGDKEAEQAHFSAYAAFSETLSQVKTASNWIDENLNRVSYEYAGSKLDREIWKDDESDTFSIDFTATRAKDVTRELTADFVPSSGPVFVVIVLDRTIELGSMDNCEPNVEHAQGTLCAISDFIRMLGFNPFARLLLVTFGDTAETFFGFENAVSRDRFSELQEVFKAEILRKPVLDTESNPGKGIKLGHQLIIARPEWQDVTSEYKYHMVLVTDGELDLPSRFADLGIDDQLVLSSNPEFASVGVAQLKFFYALTRADMAKKDRITVHVVDVGTRPDAEEANAFLKSISGTNQVLGEENLYYQAGATGLNEAMKQIFLSMGKANTLVLREPSN